MKRSGSRYAVAGVCTHTYTRRERGGRYSSREQQQCKRERERKRVDVTHVGLVGVPFLYFLRQESWGFSRRG